MIQLEWKDMFKKDIRDKLRESKKEYDEYVSTNQVVYLQQAGNKLFSVVENYLMLKYNTRVRSYDDLKILVKNNSFDIKLLKKVSLLHYFFYQNEIEGDADSYAVLYVEIYDIMKGRVK